VPRHLKPSAVQHFGNSNDGAVDSITPGQFAMIAAKPPQICTLPRSRRSVYLIGQVSDLPVFWLVITAVV
jgi:hypothetical protein